MPASDDAPPSRPRATHYFPGGERLAFFILLSAILVLAYRTIRPFLLVLLLAGGVASLTFGLQRRLTRALGGRRWLAAALSVALLMVGVLGPLCALVIAGTHLVVVEINQLSPTLATIEEPLLRLADRLGPYGAPLRKFTTQLASTLENSVPALAQRVGEFAGEIGSAVLHLTIELFIFVVSLYYFLVDGDEWHERAIHLLPIADDFSRSFFSRFRQVSLAVIVGNLGSAAVQGAFAGVGYLIFGVPAPLLLAMVTAIMSFIPAVGTLLVWVPAALWLGVRHGWLRAALFGAFCAILVATVDNVVRPAFIRRGLRMHPLLIFVAVFGGLASFGASGVFFGPLVMALAIAALDIYDREPPSSLEI